MTGPEHYKEAERVAAACMSTDRAGREGFTGWSRFDLAALAQVHATLALSAADLRCRRHRRPASQRRRMARGVGMTLLVAVNRVVRLAILRAETRR